MNKLSWLMDQLYPQQNICHLCGRSMQANEAWLCEDCLARMEECLLPPSLQIAMNTTLPITSLSPCQMTGACQRLIHALKYGHDKTASQPLAEFMVTVFARYVQTRFPFPTLIVSVPSSPSTFRVRGYNQAEELARAVSDRLHIPYQSGVLKRNRKSRSQIGKTKQERIMEMIHAFEAGESLVVKDQVVLLIDDVMTTGATIRACSMVLLEEGALQVVALTACRR